jgi:hypothetical protein
MSPAGILAPSAVLLSLLLVLGASPSCHGAWSHNITDVLAAYPEFSDFSAALSRTGAAADIDPRNTITVLAVDNAAMSAAQSIQPVDLKRAVSLHVLLDYFDDAKLSSLQGRSVKVTSLYQASGNAPGADGIVTVTTQQGGRVAFMAPALSGIAGAPPTVFYLQKSVETTPYDIAVLQVDALISSQASGSMPAQAPAAPPPAAPATPPATPPLAAPATPPATRAPAAPTTPPATRAPAAPTTPPATHAPAAPPAPAPVAAPATTPTPRRRPAPEPPVSAPETSSDDVDDKPPANHKNNGAMGTASWTLGATVAAVVLTIMLVL